MSKKAWTVRGEMLETDRAVIRAVVDNNKAAARIFVTGEVHERYIGDAAERILINVNNTLYQNGASSEPLFVQTKADTVRMTRFDPAFVWKCFDPGILVELVKAETDRLGVEMDPYGMDEFDFYQSLIASMRKTSGGAAAMTAKGSGVEDFYNAVYLSCLLLFGKPGYMDVPVAAHFAQPAAADFLRTSRMRKLNPVAQKNLEKLRGGYGHIEAITNPEIDFIVGLYEGGLA